jgi:energy-coupling factor transporter ATP-binding protein EcfA2
VDALCIFGLKGSNLVYTYWAYGLKVGSQIPFPELFPIEDDGPMDLDIVLGDIPTIEKTETGYHSAEYDITPDAYRITIKDIASYHVSEGKRIIISAHAKADQDSIRLFCLSNAFAAALHQRKTIPLHCSAIIDKGELVLVFGASGAGKSTTMASFLQKGYKPFSDDVCVPVVQAASDEIMLFSSYPMMKFWKETLYIAGFLRKADRKIRPDMEKYGIYYHEDFLTTSLKPKLIVLLEKDDKIEAPVIELIGGIKLFQLLEANAYRGEYLGFSDLKKEHFMLFTQLANQTRCFVLKRPTSGNFVKEVAEKIINLLS